MLHVCVVRLLACAILCVRNGELNTAYMREYLQIMYAQVLCNANTNEYT